MSCHVLLHAGKGTLAFLASTLLVTFNHLRLHKWCHCAIDILLSFPDVSFEDANRVLHLENYFTLSDFKQLEYCLYLYIALAPSYIQTIETYPKF